MSGVYWPEVEMPAGWVDERGDETAQRHPWLCERARTGIPCQDGAWVFLLTSIGCETGWIGPYWAASYRCRSEQFNTDGRLRYTLEMHDSSDVFWFIFHHIGNRVAANDLGWLLDNGVPFTIAPVFEEHVNLTGDINTACFYFIRIADKAKASLFKLFRRHGSA